MSKCIGCGAVLQTQKPEIAGYVPEIIFIEQGENAYCKRCHDIRNHNKVYEDSKLTFDYDEYYNKIKQIKKTNSLVLLMIDVLDINGSFIEKLNEMIGDNKVVLLINKIDLLPKSLKLAKIEDYVKKVAKRYNIDVFGTIMMSSIKNKNIEAVVNKIRKLKFSRTKKVLFDDVYVLGRASVGKSTFINTLTKLYGGETNNLITTSDQNGTTIDFIKIPLDRKSYIIDTPGLINNHAYGAYLDYDSMKKVMAKGFLKAKVYQLKSNQTIFIAGLLRIDFLSGENITVTTYVSNDLYIHRTKLENADHIENTQLTKLLAPPFKEHEVNLLSEKVSNEYKFSSTEEQKYYDLAVSGLGYIHIGGKEVEMKVTKPKQILSSFSKSFIS